MKMLAIALCFALAGCAKLHAPPPPVRAADFPDDMPSCIGDDDCVLTTFAGCCRCPDLEHVASRVELAMSEAPCAAVECNQAPGRCGRPQPKKYARAACEHGHCIAK